MLNGETATGPTPEQVVRQQAMALLAQASGRRLGELWAAWPDRPAYHRVRGPETGLVMVRGRAGGGGNPFNLGEATVTRATVRLESGEIGHAYCLGRDSDKAVIAACFDALLQRHPDNVEALVLVPLRTELAAADQLMRDETAATKVDFFTMVRGDD